MARDDDDFSSPPRRDKRDPITGIPRVSNPEPLKSNAPNSVKHGGEYSRTSDSRRSKFSNKSSASNKSKQAERTGHEDIKFNSAATDHLSREWINDASHLNTQDQRSDATPRPSAHSRKTLLMQGIDYLSRREHSAHELRRKLAHHAKSEEELESTIQRLQRENWQNDERFVHMFTHAKQSRWGTHKVIYALQNHQLDPDLLIEIKDQLRDTEFERALEVYQRKYRTSLAEFDDFQREYAKRVRFMMSRGFNAEIVGKVLKEPCQDQGE